MEQYGRAFQIKGKSLNRVMEMKFSLFMARSWAHQKPGSYLGGSPLSPFSDAVDLFLCDVS